LYLQESSQTVLSTSVPLSFPSLLLGIRPQTPPKNKNSNNTTATPKNKIQRTIETTTFPVVHNPKTGQTICGFVNVEKV
jgi:hypothetical protein